MRWLRSIGLSLVLLGLFGFSVIGQLEAGFRAYNQDRREHAQPPLAQRRAYLGSGHFISSLAENMESEFLQMALFVSLTTWLYQKGSAESKKPPEEETEEDRRQSALEDEYCAARRARHPILWRIYENSLTLALLLFFVGFFLAHGYGAWMSLNEHRGWLGQGPLRFVEVFGESDFWFESFQNWQSEFFSIAILGAFSIFLRQKDSPQSKKMRDSHWKTGGG
ncbi:MAG TPA: hypothetical protein PLW65_24325 [Pseudomonadota bacterium]|nr:hypothetical protein [Pseudomonadota bacterium]